MRRFVVGDIHGGHKALVQVLERAGFDKEVDLLISLGDTCDGWFETRQTIDFLLSLRHFVFVRGNHDQWFLNFQNTGQRPPVWTTQGGQATLDSYHAIHPVDVPMEHRRLFRDSKPYVIFDNMLFVHGGFNPQYDPRLQDPEVLMWDRALLRSAFWNYGLQKTGTRGHATAVQAFGTWENIFVGHTPVSNFIKRGDQGEFPQRWLNVVAMDTGAGWTGKLSVMDIDNGEIWQSDRVPDLYPGVMDRR